MSESRTIEATIQFHRGSKGRKILRSGTEFGTEPLPESGRVPRIARLLALALRFDGLVQAGTVKNYADLASMGHVTRARISQIMNLRLLAPDIQEEILFLKRAGRGQSPNAASTVGRVGSSGSIADWSVGPTVSSATRRQSSISTGRWGIPSRSCE